MPSRRSKRQVAAEGPQEVEDPGDADQATRRSMYIKELEERSKLNSQSESDRNRALVQEAAELRKEMLRLRSKVLKLSISLSGIGSEVGKILDKVAPDESGEERLRVDSSGSPSDTNASQAVESLETLARTMAEATEEEEACADRVRQGSERVGQAAPADDIPGPDVSTHPAEEPNLHQADDAIMDFEQPNPARGNSEAPALGFDDFAVMAEHGHDGHLAAAPEPLQEELINIVEPVPSSLPPLGHGGQHDLSVDLHPQHDVSFDRLDAAPFPDSEAWMLSMFSPMQDLGSCDFGGQASAAAPAQMAEQEMTGAGEMDEVNFTTIPPVPSQTGLILPPGLFPVPKAKGFHQPFQMQSRLSEHVETLEQHIRCKLNAMPDRITRQRLYQCCAGIMTLFTQNAWPSTHPVWFKSQVPEIIGPILMWRLHPTPESYEALLPDYKPTELQLTVPHSPVIDWVTYAPLRDRVLLCYNGSITLDRLLGEFLNSQVVQINDVSQILPHAPRGKGYFGVWNVFRGIDNNSPDGPDHVGLPISTGLLDSESSRYKVSIQQAFGNAAEGFQLQEVALDGRSPTSPMGDRAGRRQSSASDASRPPSVTKILTTPELALRLSHDIRLYAAKAWRLDGNFFKAWPELKFDGYEKIVAQGRSYRISTEPPDAPNPMTEDTIKIYHEALQSIV
ncbi:hypothetical protein ACJ41O_015010 [Fusarium nematophilum]